MAYEKPKDADTLIVDNFTDSPEYTTGPLWIDRVCFPIHTAAWVVNVFLDQSTDTFDFLDGEEVMMYFDCCNGKQFKPPGNLYFEPSCQCEDDEDCWCFNGPNDIKTVKVTIPIYMVRKEFDCNYTLFERQLFYTKEEAWEWIEDSDDEDLTPELTEIDIGEMMYQTFITDITNTGRLPTHDPKAMAEIMKNQAEEIREWYGGFSHYFEDDVNERFEKILSLYESLSIDGDYFFNYMESQFGMPDYT